MLYHEQAFFQAAKWSVILSLTSSKTPDAQRKRLIPVTLLMILYFILSIHDLLRFPPFIDESWHIGFAQDVLSGHIFAGATHGKFLAPIWMALFIPMGISQLFLARAATVLFSMIGLAFVYGLTANLVNRRAALLAMLLYALSPYLLFYDRMALIDTYLMVFSVLVVWAAARLRQRVTLHDAILCGLALVGALAAKGTGVVLLAIPTLTLIFTFHRSSWPVRWLAVCYGTFAVIWTPLYLILRWRGINYFGLAESLSGTTSSTDFWQRLLGNTIQVGQIDISYFSLIAIALTTVVILCWLLKDFRNALYLLSCIAIPTLGIILLSPEMRPRYIVYHVPLLIIAVVAGMDALRQLAVRYWPATGVRVALSVAVLAWMWLVFVPFYQTLLLSPAELPLPSMDRGEYITDDSAGFALPEVADFFRNENTALGKPLHVVGLLANCGGLQLVMLSAHNVIVDCPTINYNGSEQAHLAATVNQLPQESPSYVVLENLPYVSTEGITAPMKFVTSFERPGGVTHLNIYRIGKQ